MRLSILFFLGFLAMAVAGSDTSESVNCTEIKTCTECLADPECAFYSGQGHATPFCDKIGAYETTDTFAAVNSTDYCGCYDVNIFIGPYACQKYSICQYCYDPYEMNDGDEDYPWCQPKLFTCSTQG